MIKERENKNYLELREQFPEFIFESASYQIDDKDPIYLEPIKGDNKENLDLLRGGIIKITFGFTAGDFKFAPSLTIYANNDKFSSSLNELNRAEQFSIKKDELEKFIIHTGIIESFSYIKLFCSPKLIIKLGAFYSREIEFYQDLFMQGMGEYFYVNKIDYTTENFFEITVCTLIDKVCGKDIKESSADNSTLGSVDLRDLDREEREDGVANLTAGGSSLPTIKAALIPFAGGKDSFLTLSLFRDSKKANSIEMKRIGIFTLNPILRVKEILTDKEFNYLSDFNEVVFVNVERSLDPLLLELNREGYLNGHTPFSALLAMIGSFAASLYGFTDLVLSNEASSNQGNVIFLNKFINHQYSKSLDFEKKFNQLLKDTFNTNLNYFSLLRSFDERKITEKFSVDEYAITHFLSCNRGARLNKWCCGCPKCLSVFIILSEKIGVEKVVKIFGQNLLDLAELEEIFLELIGRGEKKPFECVGTFEETRASLQHIVEEIEAENLPLLLRKYQELEGIQVESFANISSEDAVPKYYKPLINSR